jgi:hypothetical protein
MKTTSPLHTIAELSIFRSDAFACGMTQDDITALINSLAENPLQGDVMKGTGGCRKLRVAGKGKGKSGAFRIITFFSGHLMPVYLITAFGKNERANLTKAECAALAKMTANIVDEYKIRLSAIG